YYNPVQCSSKSFQMLDYWAPVIHSTGVNEINTSTILVWANVSDWGSGVSEVYLHYQYSSKTVNGGYASEIQKEKFLMTFNQTHYVYALVLSESGILTWQIEAFDLDDQVDATPSLTGEYSYSYTISSGFDIISVISTVIIAILGTILVISTLYTGSKIYQRRKKQTLSEISKSREKLDSLLNTYLILVTTAVGLPVYNVSNIMYRSTSEVQDVLSGLSVGIDSFLESFQSDIVDFFLERDSDLFDNQTKDNIKTSIIEKNKVQIQIISSPSFRIFLFLKKKPPEYIKSAFISIAREFEEKIILNELGVVDEDFVGPIAEKVISHRFPLALLSPFQIDVQKLKLIEEKLKQGDPISKDISRSSLNALKRLVIIKSNLDVNINDPQAQINLFDKSLAQNKLHNIPPLILNEALDIFRILKVKTKVVYKALWLGSNPAIKIVVSKANIPHEEIQITQ
ncbi:MAG: hypothetical protein ACFFDC_18560, partial [Promethearchaeota archaeon]